MSLRTKFTIYISLLILFVILGISISIFISQKSMYSTLLEQTRERIFRDLVYTCNESLVVRDEIQIFNVISSVIKVHSPKIVYAGYVSPFGTVLFKSRDHEESLKYRISSVSGETIEDFFSPNKKEQIREYSVPFFIREEYRGTIRVGFSQSYHERQIKEMLVLLTKKIFEAAAIAFAAGIIIANILAFYLNKPILALAVAAESIGNGDLNARVEIDRRDELGSLGHSFNKMSKKLKELDVMKDSFVSSVSHELRSPLAAIGGYCDFLLDALNKNLTKEKQEKSLKIIKDAAIRLTGFVNNILDLTKIKAGHFELRKVPVDIYQITCEIVSLFESLAEKQKKKIKIDISEHLPNVNADQEKIKQIMTNLLGNALKFTSENDVITISAKVVEPHRGISLRAGLRRYLEVWVQDTGIGIPQEDLRSVFDKFYQVSESETKKPKGTGLGLAIVAEIIKMHDGKVWVESVLGKGSTFKFILPM
ncbi:MAG: HAMP domain-containing sensor histidine kinase [Elusimicrobia bacterium]|nr:HAMP domain-containing sensor histidine kinase [Elusimicrobiota bacterium]